MDNKIVEEIKNLTMKIKKENDLKEDVIREDVFNILQGITNCMVLYYPMNDEANEDGCDGCHIVRTVKGVERQLVYINSANTKERQAFSAAHELGHIWKVDERLKEKFPDIEFDVEDAINRFAAELLMPEEAFKEQTQKKLEALIEDRKKTDNIKIMISDVIKLIVFLMDYFFSPYKAVVIRLVETGYINDIAKNKLLDYKDSKLVESIIREKQYPRLGIKTMNISVANLVDKLEEIEKQKLFSENKIREIKEKFELPEIDEGMEMKDEIDILNP